MKKANHLLYLSMIFILSLLLLSSCSDNDSNSNSTSPPVITNVSQASDPQSTPTTIGYADNLYIIKGLGFSSLQKVYFNDVDTYFNPTMVTDNAIFITIDRNTPYENASDELRIVTKAGTATYHFVVAPPAPDLTSYHPINAADGDQITIYGTFFLNPIVTIGGVQATVVSNTLSQIIAIVPSGSQGKTVTVTTISGSDSFSSPLGTAIYDDILYSGAVAGGWGETHELDHSTAANVAQGEKAIKCTISAWSGFTIDNGPAVYPTATGFRFRMKLQDAAQIRLVFNFDWGHQYYMDITNEYKEYTVNWSDFGLSGPPASFQQLVFGSTGADTVFYLDDIGYKLN